MKSIIFSANIIVIILKENGDKERLNERYRHSEEILHKGY
jgi:hypothetical protein